VNIKEKLKSGALICYLTKKFGCRFCKFVVALNSSFPLTAPEWGHLIKLPNKRITSLVSCKKKLCSVTFLPEFYNWFLAGQVSWNPVNFLQKIALFFTDMLP